MERDIVGVSANDLVVWYQLAVEVPEVLGSAVARHGSGRDGMWWLRLRVRVEVVGDGWRLGA